MKCQTTLWRSWAKNLRLIGLDPGLRATGWGVIDVSGSRLTHVANGSIETNSKMELAHRLAVLHRALMSVFHEWRPERAAVEETFVNKNPTSTLKLGQARGVVLMTAALADIAVAEYTPNHVKKAVVGVGHAEKDQVHAMVRRLLPGVVIKGMDSADALAVAIADAHHSGSAHRIATASARSL